MKNSFLLLLIFSVLFTVSKAQRVQGTIRNANAPLQNEVIVSIKPTTTFTAIITNLIVTVQIPTSVGPRPTISFTNLQPGLFGTWTQLDADQGDGYYTWAFNCVTPGSGNIATTVWPATELDILKITFLGTPVPLFAARLCHYLDGGIGNYAIFYVETNLAAVNGGVLSDWGNLFYGTGAVNGPANPGAIGTPNASYSYTTAPNVTLPVKFLDFTASKKDNNAVLSWLIENESAQTDRYEIERSLNGTDFTKVNTVAAKNNGKSSNTYNLTDLNLASLRSAGIIYYRIKQIDKDGLFIYSTTKNLRLNAKAIAISIYPNPVKNDANISIDLEENTKANITIIDAEGKQLKNLEMQLFKGLNVKKINMASMAAGSYLLKIETPMETKTISVVKAN